MKTESLAEYQHRWLDINFRIVKKICIRILRKIERQFNSITCIIMNGGHELYTVRNNDKKIYQQCLLCEHETKGWKLKKKVKNDN